MTEYEILFPANGSYTGMVHLATLDKKKEMKSLGGCFYADLSTRISELTIMKDRNYYITANAMIPFTRRCSDNLLILSNIVLDFDIHEQLNQHYREELINEFVWRIKRDLFEIAEPFRIYSPNILHRTTRGVQLWFHIDSASAKLLWLYRKTIDNLVLIFKAFLSEYPELEKHITIDVAAAKNGCGLYRLFNTWNTHTGKKTEVELLHSESIELNELFRSLCEHDFVKQALQRPKYQKRGNINKQGQEVNRRGNSYNALHQKRLAFIEWWSTQQENSVGKRDLMLYLGYNAAIQIMTPEEAQKWCQELNRGFSKPLKDITYIFDEIKKPFQIRNATFYEMLGVNQTDERRFETEYSKTSTNLTRNAEIRKRKAAADQKKERARNLIAEGFPYAEIAQTAGLSVSTVKRLATTVEIRQKAAKPWEKLGISKSTYYRKLKSMN